MAVDIRVDGVLYQSASTYWVTEDSTPIDPSDSSGGTGQFSFAINEPESARELIWKEVDLEDGTQGTTRGIIRDLTSPNGLLSAIADSRTNLLVAERQVQPYTGTLEGWFEYILGLVGVTSEYVIDEAIADIPVTFPGFYGVLWDYVKKMCQAIQVEVSLVSDNIVLRPLRTRRGEIRRDSSRTWSLATSELARSIEIYYYQNQYLTDRLVYPEGGWNEDVPVFVVNAGETAVYDIPLTASLVSIDQPVCVASVDRFYDDSSVYSVVGTGAGSDLPLAPAQWAAGGGSVTVAINPDTKSITVTVVGSAETQYAPYRIAMTAGPSDTYSSLRLIGDGVFTDKQLLTLYTSVDHDKVTREVGVTVDNELISTQEQAYHAGLWALKRYGSARHTISISTTGINRLGESGSYAYPTIADFNTLYAGDDIGDFNALWPGDIESLNIYMRALVQGDFANQAFGNVAGARVPNGDAFFRIRTATNSETGISYTAEDDTIISDFNTVWDGMSIADFNTEWGGETLLNAALAPLRRTVA